MKKYIVWFLVIVAAVVAGSLITSWILKRQNTELQTQRQKHQNADAERKTDAWDNRPKIGFNATPASPATC